jgi:hypothetical protein
MESLKIKSKRNIHRKQYQTHLKWKKEMTPTLGFCFGRFFSKMKPFACVLDLKDNFKKFKN